MEIKKLFCKFKRKLMLEAIGKAVLLSATCSGTVLFLILLSYHIAIKRAPIMILIGVGVGVFVVVFLLRFIPEYPTAKKIAKRLDQLGLRERIGTMLEFQDSDSEMIRLQREDAKAHLEQITAKQIVFQFQKKEMIVAIISICLAATMLVLPYDVFDFSDPTELSEEEREQIIEEMVEELQQKIEDSGLDEETKKELYEVIDRLEEDLMEADSELEQAALIEDAKQEMQEILERIAEENPEMKEAVEQLEKELDETLDEKKDELLGNKTNEKVEEPENPEEESQEEEKQEESSEGGEPQGDGQGDGNGQGGSEGSTMTEGIYDPLLGRVQFGEVFAMYYAEYLEAVEKGEVPEDLQKIMDQYYGTLE